MHYFHLDGKTYTHKNSIARLVKNYGMTYKEYYDKYEKEPGEGICLFCQKETIFSKGSYRKFCDCSCASKYNQNGKYRDNMTDLEAAAVSEKLSSANKKRDKSWILKREITIKNKYGVSYEELKRREFNSRLDKMSSIEKKEFYDRATSAPRKGNGLKYKPYFLDGKEIYIQGYENFLLDWLKELFSESDIEVCRSIMFRYIDENGKQRRYFPDVKVQNMVFEVKSRYTFQNNREETILKLKSVKEAGLIPILVLIDPKQIEMCKKDLIETISSQAFEWFEGRFNDYPFIGVGYKQMISEVLETHENGS